MVRFSWLIPLAVLLTAAQDVFQDLEEEPEQLSIPVDQYTRDQIQLGDPGQVLDSLRTPEKGPSGSWAHRSAAGREEEFADEEVEGYSHVREEVEEKLEDLRQLLLYDEKRRNVPAALEGYQQLYEQLEDVLDAQYAAQQSLHPMADMLIEGTQPLNTSLLPPELPILAHAAFELAVMTLTGLAGDAWPRNDSMGIAMLATAAEGGNVNARLALAYRQYQGMGREKDCDRAFQTGKDAAQFMADEAEKGVIRPPEDQLLIRERWRNADYLMPLNRLINQAGEGQVAAGWAADNPLDGFDLYGLMHGNNGEGSWNWLAGLPFAEEPNTLEMWRRLAAAGDPTALFNVGWMALQGYEVEKNGTAAYLLFGMAAQKGYPPAYNALGVMFYNGETLPRDNAAAVRWFEAGVRAGDVDSHYNLASMLLTGGVGVEKDLERGLKLMKEANRAGHWQAPLQLAVVHHNGEAVPKDCRKAFRHLTTFLNEQSTWPDDVNVAVHSLDTGDEWQGLLILAFAAEQGSPAAQNNLAFALQHSKTFDLPERQTLAFEMYVRSGEYLDSGLTDAAHLAWNGRHQLSGGVNRTLAMELYTQASAQGDTEATFHLARAYQTGSAVQQNITKAREMFKLAIREAPFFRYAAAPWLALIFLRLEIIRWALLRKLGAISRVSGLAASQRLRKGLTWKIDLPFVISVGVGMAAAFWFNRRQRLRQRLPPAAR